MADNLHTILSQQKHLTNFPNMTQRSNSQNAPLRRSKRKRKTIQYTETKTNPHSFNRTHLSQLTLDELLATAMSCIPNLRWNKTNQWCRYCGSRGSPTFAYSPWGKQKLCYIHHTMWKRNELCLSIFDEPKSIEYAINKKDCTEREYLINVIMECNETDSNTQTSDSVNSDGSEYDNTIEKDVTVEDNMYDMYTNKDKSEELMRSPSPMEQSNISPEMETSANTTKGMNINAQLVKLTNILKLNYMNGSKGKVSDGSESESMSEESDWSDASSESNQSMSNAYASESEQSEVKPVKNKKSNSRYRSILDKIMPISPPKSAKKKQNNTHKCKDNNQSLGEQIKTAQTQTFKCDHCGGEFANKRYLNIHITNKHQKSNSTAQKTYINKPFKCQICGKRFKSQSKLNDHSDRTHKDNDKKYQSSDHSKPELPKPFKCDECAYENKYKYRLDQHRLKHSSDRPFQCELCPQRFKAKRYANAHMRNVHKLPLKINVGPSLPPKPKDKHAPKRPLTSYFAYYQRHKDKFMARQMAKDGCVHMKEVAKKTAKQWRRMSEEQKRPYSEESRSKYEVWKVAFVEYKQSEEHREFKKKLRDWESECNRKREKELRRLKKERAKRDREKKLKRKRRHKKRKRKRKKYVSESDSDEEV